VRIAKPYYVPQFLILYTTAKANTSAANQAGPSIVEIEDLPPLVVDAGVEAVLVAVPDVAAPPAAELVAEAILDDGTEEPAAAPGVEPAVLLVLFTALMT